VDTSGGGNIATLVSDPAALTAANFPSGGVTAIKDLTLTDGTGTVIPDNLTVYVYGTLTVDGEAPTLPGSSNSIVAIGNVTLGTNSAANANALATKVDVSKAVITLASGKANYTLPSAAFTGREIQVLGEQAELTLGGATGLNVYLGGNGTLKLPAVSGSAIIRGNGNVEFGTNITLIDADSITANSITFGGTVTLPDGKEVTLNGDVVLGDNKTITFGSTGGATLNLDGSIAVKGAGASDQPEKVLETDGKPVVLTSANAALLTAAAADAAAETPAKLT
jgi:hypothetical protein